MIITLLYNNLEQEGIKGLKKELPQFNYVEKTKSGFLSPKDINNLQWLPEWEYYIIRARCYTKEISYNETTRVITIDYESLKYFLRTVGSKYNVVIDTSSVSLFFEVMYYLSYIYRTEFYRVYSYKHWDNLYSNRWAINKTDNHTINESDKNPFPKLCNNWRHGSPRLSQALTYKRRDNVIPYLYYGEMKCKSIVDYSPDKVCCQSAVFTEPKEIYIKDVLSLASVNEHTPKEKANTTALTARYLQVNFWEGLKGLTILDLSCILNVYQQAQTIAIESMNLILVYKDGKPYLERVEDIHPYNEADVEGWLTRRYWPKQANKIIKYQKEKYNYVYVKSFTK